MFIRSHIPNRKILLAFALGAAVPLTAAAAQAPASSQKKTDTTDGSGERKSYGLGGKKMGPKTKPPECTYEETNEQICDGNDEHNEPVYLPKLVEHCPLPL